MKRRWTTPWKATARPWRARRCQTINAQLIAVERTLILPDGLPGRPWYRNQIYAPGLYTGYGVKTLPGVRESIEAETVEAGRGAGGTRGQGARKLPARRSSRPPRPSGSEDGMQEEVKSRIPSSLSGNLKTASSRARLILVD